jgi:peptide/nickel transport system substrate-binding protein
MLRKLFRMLPLLLVIGALLFGAAPKSVRIVVAQDGQNILLYGGNQDIDNIDPATGENYSINAALLSLYDALFIVRGENLEPNLVDTWEVNEDATVFTFNLKQNARFHDGSPVNADAVVYSFSRMMQLEGPPTYRWAGIADENSAVAIDEFTVQFTLSQAFAPFLGTLSQLYIVNPAVVEANLGEDFGQTYLRTNSAGSGPFVQGRWEIGNLYEFIAAPDYWGGWRGDGRLDGFLWLIQRDSQTQLNSLLARETHIADTPSGQDRQRIDDDPGLNVQQNFGFFINTLKMNTQGEYTSDLNVRKAVAYAMNYAVLPDVQDIPVEVMPGPTPLNFPGAVADLDVPTYDLDRAREFLAQSPWPDGGFTLDYVYVAEFTREEIPGLLLLEGLAELNITLNMVPMLWPDMVASCATPETGPDLINIYTQPAYLDMDAHLYNQYHSGQWGSFNSCSFYSNPEVDSLLDEARVTGDPAVRTEMYNEAQRLIAADQPSVWMYAESTLLAFNDCVKGYQYRPLESLSVLFQDLWMDNCPA